MTHKEKIYKLYNRTYRNCEYYRKQGKQKELLNEIGVLRGIVYSLDAVTGNPFTVINQSEFYEMISEQNRIRNEA